MKKLWLTLAAVVMVPFTLALLVGGWYLRESEKDVLVQIREPYSPMETSSMNTDTASNQGERRIFHDVRIVSKASDTTLISVSLPDSGIDQRLPVVIVLGGLEAGRKSLAYIPQHGRNALISYQYPFNPSYFEDGAYFTDFQRIRVDIVRIPAQMSLAIEWITQQRWADTDRIILLGYSLGAMALPAVQHLAQVHGYPIRATALCYGAMDYDYLIYHNFKDRFPGVTPLTSKIGATLIRPMEPRWHIEALRGEFLVVNGTLDHRIPFVKAQEFQDLVPVPKTVINLEEGHMHPRKPELTQKLIQISRDWLLEKELVNP